MYRPNKVISQKNPKCHTLQNIHAIIRDARCLWKPVTANAKGIAHRNNVNSTTGEARLLRGVMDPGGARRERNSSGKTLSALSAMPQEF